MSGGLDNSATLARLYASINKQASLARNKRPLSPTPTPRPHIPSAREEEAAKTAGGRTDSTLAIPVLPAPARERLPPTTITALIGVVAVIVAALIGIMPLLNQNNKGTPTSTETTAIAPPIAAAQTQTLTALTVVAAQSSPTSTPTSTSNPTPTHSPSQQPTTTSPSIDDLIAQTKAVWATGTAIVIASFTKTPTPTPTSTFAETPNIQKSIEAMLTATAQLETASAAASFTETLAPTITLTQTSTQQVTIPTLTNQSAATVAAIVPGGTATPHKPFTTTRTDVLAYCDNKTNGEPRKTFPTGSQVTIYWSWLAKTPEQIKDHIDQAQYEVRVDGQPLANWNDYRTEPGKSSADGNYYVFWYVPIGMPDPGDHKVDFKVTWKQQIFDGFKHYGPGGDVESDTGTCVFRIE